MRNAVNDGSKMARIPAGKDYDCGRRDYFGGTGSGMMWDGSPVN